MDATDSDIPPEWWDILRTIARTRGPYARVERLAVGGPNKIGHDILAAMAAAGWIERWADPGGQLGHRWTLSPWAAVYLGVELAEPLAAGRDPRWYRSEGDGVPAARARDLGVAPLPRAVRLPAHAHAIRFSDLNEDQAEEVAALAWETLHPDEPEPLCDEDGEPVELWGRKVFRGGRQGKRGRKRKRPA